MNIKYPLELELRLSRLLKLPAWIAGISFLIGTLILLTYLITREEGFMGLGFLFTLFAAMVNACAFGTLAVCSFLFKEYRNIILERAALLLVNIPVAMLYAFVAFNTK